MSTGSFVLPIFFVVVDRDELRSILKKAVEDLA